MYFIIVMIKYIFFLLLFLLFFIVIFIINENLYENFNILLLASHILLDLPVPLVLLVCGICFCLEIMICNGICRSNRYNMWIVYTRITTTTTIKWIRKKDILDVSLPSYPRLQVKYVNWNRFASHRTKLDLLHVELLPINVCSYAKFWRFN